MIEHPWVKTLHHKNKEKVCAPAWALLKHLFQFAPVSHLPHGENLNTFPHKLQLLTKLKKLWGRGKGASLSPLVLHRSHSPALGHSLPAAVTTPQQAAQPTQTVVWKWLATQGAALRTCLAWMRGLVLLARDCPLFAALRTSGWTSCINSGQ